MSTDQCVHISTAPCRHDYKLWKPKFSLFSQQKRSKLTRCHFPLSSIYCLRDLTLMCVPVWFHPHEPFLLFDRGHIQFALYVFPCAQMHPLSRTCVHWGQLSTSGVKRLYTSQLSFDKTVKCWISKKKKKHAGKSTFPSMLKTRCCAWKYLVPLTSSPYEQAKTSILLRINFHVNKCTTAGAAYCHFSA